VVRRCGVLTGWTQSILVSKVGIAGQLPHTPVSSRYFLARSIMLLLALSLSSLALSRILQNEGRMNPPMSTTEGGSSTSADPIWSTNSERRVSERHFSARRSSSGAVRTSFSSKNWEGQQRLKSGERTFLQRFVATSKPSREGSTDDQSGAKR
jgi:hypothetical protein